MGAERKCRMALESIRTSYRRLRQVPNVGRKEPEKALLIWLAVIPNLMAKRTVGSHLLRGPPRCACRICDRDFAENYFMAGGK